MAPAKRRTRVLSIAEKPSSSPACACDHHGNNDKPNLPWLPKRVHFSGIGTAGQAQTKAIPSLLPLNALASGGPSTSGANDGPTATATSQALNGNGNEIGNGETLRAQIRLNTQIMSTIEELRNEMDQLKKERNFYKLKYTTANEQLAYLKKKVGKNGQEENINPNVNAVERLKIRNNSTKPEDDTNEANRETDREADRQADVNEHQGNNSQ